MSRVTKNDWRVHTSQLLTEIVNCSGNAIYEKPLNIFGKILAMVGERAAELDDPVLNALMCRLTIYEIADPYSPDYDPALVQRLMQLGKELHNPYSPNYDPAVIKEVMRLGKEFQKKRRSKKPVSVAASAEVKAMKEALRLLETFQVVAAPADNRVWRCVKKLRKLTQGK